MEILSLGAALIHADRRAEEGADMAKVRGELLVTSLTRLKSK